jgi:hypothetical protein
MKPPRRIKLGGHVWTLHFGEIPKKYEEYFGDQLENLFGCTNRENMEIWISTKYSPAVQKQTLLHELMHAMAYVFVPQSFSAFDEKEIERLSCALYALIEQNKPLIEWLTKE